MPYPEWGETDVLSRELIVDRENEERCPNSPKVPLVDYRSFDDAVESTWNQYELNEWRGTEDRTRGNAFNVQRLLCEMLPSERLCAYHLGRGMAAVTLEVIGFPCNQYRPLVAPMIALMEKVTIGAPPSYISEAREVFQDFMKAEEDAGTQGFAARYRATEPVSRKKARWWQR
ncbi:hypothetical protein ACFV16_31375 [Streptomyces massasporeus]|uniref:hypothetical protein n=1 Tax=Streptomyces massasporeus TaxID=67324 RepID=UPI003682132A